MTSTTVVPSSTPRTINEAKHMRASSKRKLTSLIKESDTLLRSDGLPQCEFRVHANRMRKQLDDLQGLNEHFILLKCSTLNSEDFTNERGLEEAEEKIAKGQESYFDEVRDAALPVIHELIKRGEKIVPPDGSGTSSTHSKTPTRMEKLKFPSFSGDIREYKLFKRHFLHFTQYLNDIERLYQLIESMERATEKNKIKSCLDINRAWVILDEAYGDDDRLIDTLLRDLEKLDCYATKGKVSLTDMGKFVESLQNFVTQVESVGMKSDLSGRVLLTQIRRKLPEEHCILFLEDVRDGKSDDSVDGLVRWLHSHLILLRKAKCPTDSHSADASAKSGGGKSYYGFKAHKSASSSAVSPGNGKDRKGNSNNKPKCPLHPQTSNHFLKGCHKFRSLDQSQKFDLMNANGICRRCGHNNCVAGKRPFDHAACQFASNCTVPTCGMNTHFSSICPRVYGLEGYRHYDKTFFHHGPTETAPSSVLSTEAKEFLPRKLPPIQKNANLTLEVGPNKTFAETDKISCALPTVMGYVRYGRRKKVVRILLDTGSQISLIREGVLPQSVNNKMQDFSLTTVGGDTVNLKLRVVDCVLESLNGEFRREISLTEMKKPCGDAPIITNEQVRHYSHFDNIEIVEPFNARIDVLLGVDNGDVLTSEERILSKDTSDPVAVKCPLGWYIQGGRDEETVISAAVNFVQISVASEIEDFLGIDRVGMEPRRCGCATEELNRLATHTMKESVTKLGDGSYQISLPWKKSPKDLPNNYDYAVKRFQNLEQQFKNKPREWEMYCDQMYDQLHREVARLVPKDEIEKDIDEGKGMWFLPHFAVLKESRTTPVRVVYDGKARYQGHSLNDYLAKGHNMNMNLFEIALRFRENEIGIIADITKMFQAVKIAPDDARFHRYVFRKAPEDPMEVYELQTVTFGDKPSPTAATIVLRHVAAENAPDEPDIQRVLAKQFYVDDLNDSLRSVEEAKRLKENLTVALEKGNFRIRKWLSNKKGICDPEYYPQDGKVTTLGTRWDLKDDTLSVKEVNIEDFVPTKRNILKTVASYYDTFGILSGILIRPKILIQKLWMLGVEWDAPIRPDSDLYKLWETAKRDLKEVKTIKIERCLIPRKHRGESPLPTVSLHGFSDASEDAMGIGIWLRWSKDDENDGEIIFVCARARLTPLKQLSMPRKELQAVLLLSRMMIVVKEALRFEIVSKMIWTDSMTVISWLRGQSKSFRSYVACRVGEITMTFDPNSEISHVPSDQNIVDLVSRGVDVNDMKKVVEGPTFLRRAPMYWPETPKNVPVNRDDIERKKFHVRNAKVLALKLDKPEPIVDPKKFSSWSKLVMVTARVMSLRDLPKKHWLSQLTSKLRQWPSRERIKEAEIYWIRYAQKDLDFEDNHIAKLNPFMDEEERVYRVGGRVDKAPLSYDIRHPYLLPRKNYICLLIARQRHRHSLHRGHLGTAIEIRKAYWIIGDVNLSRAVVRDCKVCRRHRGGVQEQKMANLPAFRVKPFTPPFQTTILDYLGPFQVKLTRNTMSKGYCAVFVCAVTRAVHLTCVQDLSTSAFLQALERFISVRGAPGLIVSDNATCFRGADNEIRELQLRHDRDQLYQHGLKFAIDWKFGPPGGPHHQGLVERMVQEVKKSMKHLVRSEKLTFIEWETLLSQIAGLLNSRPLTAASSSPLDEPPVTPNHFLIGRGDLRNPQVPCDDYNGNTRKRRELCNSMVNEFWRRWMLNIHKLSPRNKWSKTIDSLTEGDVVLVVDKNVKRGFWKMAEIIRTYAGDDELVRIVDVKYADGSVVKRPVTKLVLLMRNDERLDIV